MIEFVIFHFDRAVLCYKNGEFTGRLHIVSDLDSLNNYWDRVMECKRFLYPLGTVYEIPRKEFIDWVDRTGKIWDNEDILELARSK